MDSYAIGFISGGMMPTLLICGIPLRADHKRAKVVKWIFLVNRFSVIFVGMSYSKKSPADKIK